MAVHSGAFIVDLNEVRIARDALPHTPLQFINYYGSDARYAKWEECDGPPSVADCPLFQSHAVHGAVAMIFFPCRSGAHAKQ